MSHISAQQAKRGGKYGARKTVLDGITFDSQAEANYYARLKLRERAGEVGGVEMQPKFPLTVNGFLVGTYKADFRFYDNIEKRERVIDVKGVETREFRRTKKLVKAIHGVDVEVVKA